MMIFACCNEKHNCADEAVSHVEIVCLSDVVENQRGPFNKNRLITVNYEPHLKPRFLYFLSTPPQIPYNVFSNIYKIPLRAANLGRPQCK